MEAEQRPEPYQPPRPTLVASGVLTLWIAILSIPMWSGRFLAGPFSDQYHSGYAFRDWLAAEWKRTGRVPLWNPELFGGLPFVGAMHGDIFYPTSWMRLILPTGIAMNLGFVIHYVIAGLLTYALLRLLRIAWSGAVTGGLAYQLSGVIGSYVSPGHDGKLFVTTLLPLALIGLVLALRDRRWEGYGLVSLSIGLALVSPHAQLTYYMLVAAGLFALYLTFGEPSDRPVAARLPALGLALLAVMVGFGVGMIQVLPFFEYLPYSPRAETYYGFAGSASYAIPWTHVPEFFISSFAGTTQDQSYWAANPLKLHSEYLGLPVVALAIVGLLDRNRRRMAFWLGGTGILFLLIALGSATPFYRVWWAVMPFMKQVRAPGMALFAVAFVLAVFAAVGVERLERDGAGTRWALPWMISGGALAVLAVVGAFGGLAESLAIGVAQQAPPGTARDFIGAAATAQGPILRGALGSAVALVALGGLTFAWCKDKLTAPLFVMGLALLVGGDLWRNARGFWSFTESPTAGLYQPDEITERLRQERLPFRVFDLSDTGFELYRGSSLMAFGIPQMLGHHGNQLHAFNELMGGKNVWSYLFRSRRLWDLYAVRYVLLPPQIDLARPLVPAYADLAAEFDTLLDGVVTSGGEQGTVMVRRNPAPYARLVPAALKVPDEQAIPTVADPGSRLPFDRLVLLDTAAAVDPAPIDSLPPALDARVDVAAWEPGRMTLQIEPPAPVPAYVVVAENYYTGWRATVDGTETPVIRGDVALITVPVQAGASSVELTFESRPYQRGKLITLLSVFLVAVSLVGPPIARRRGG
ncbi:MAG TPA: hypothetical protein VGA37_04175 [Gemmatimonadales bacterium]